VALRDIFSAPAPPTDGSVAATGNCVVITGAWRRNTRYELRLRIRNAPSPATRAAGVVSKVGADAVSSSPHVWIAPLQYDTSPSGELVITVAGPSKYGAVCSLPPQRQPALSRMFDACAYARDAGVVEALQTDTNACVSALRVFRNAAKGGTARAFPFSVPPLTMPLPTAASHLAACGGSRAPSLRAGGECVSCQWGEVGAIKLGAASVAACKCGPGSLPTLAGTTACSEPLVVGYEPTTLKQLPVRLCEYFVQVSRIG